MLEDIIVKDQFLIGTDTVFDFGHRIFSPSDIACYVYNPDTKTETELTSGTDFSVGLKPETTDYSNGARVTLLTEQPAVGKLTVVRTVVPEQGVSLPNFGKIPSESLEAQLDRTIAAVQQLHDTVRLAYKIPYGQSGTVSPEQSIKDMISSGGGGGGGGGGSSYEFSNEFSVTSGGSVSVNKINKDKIDGLDSATVSTAKIASGLTETAKTEIINSAGGIAYDGPFAVKDAVGSVTVNAGYVLAGGTRYHIDEGPAPTMYNGDTLYFVLSSGFADMESSFTKTAPAITENVLVTRLANKQGGVIHQYQFGDITCVDWRVSPGGGMSFPDYKMLNQASGSVLSAGTTYMTLEDGYLRISIKDITVANGCLRVTIGNEVIGLYQITEGCAGCSFLPIPLSSGTRFNVGAITGANVLVMFDHGVDDAD